MPVACWAASDTGLAPMPQVSGTGVRRIPKASGVAATFELSTAVRRSPMSTTPLSLDDSVCDKYGKGSISTGIGVSGVVPIVLGRGPGGLVAGGDGGGDGGAD